MLVPRLNARVRQPCKQKEPPPPPGLGAAAAAPDGRAERALAHGAQPRPRVVLGS